MGVFDFVSYKDTGEDGSKLNLVGGSEEAYFERSSINFVDKFSFPVILFQGLEDKVVTPDQARKIYTALKQKGLPVALVEYEGEQHGSAASSLVVFFEIDGLNWDSWLRWLQLKETRAIFELVTEQQHLDMPELLWKGEGLGSLSD
ncbi:hypothetical protein MKW98_021146 [Papaver atlanticum]|uniref:Peptidase S9 prolyl oligopeptidase catalytic domain-containing protein n=1 Tax=Papaver atlanticum TaxID=357466 RepID=A0AAD4TA74_9MAGN|nr:hypothetical protein MKW98_021146 [Papaver atlanticum]